MKFGFGPMPAAWPDESPGHLADGILAAAKLAEEEGFDSLWIEPGQQLSGASPFPLAAAAARRTTGVRLVVRVPLGLTHPLYAAEDATALDLLSGGRAVLAPPESPSDAALAAYGLAGGDAAERTWEAIEVLHRAWAPGSFRHQGVHWKIPAMLPEHTEAAAFTEVDVTPKPAQPLIPVWTAPRSPDGIERAARLGLPVVAEADLPLDAVAELLQGHREAAPFVASLLAVALRDVHVAETDDDAWATALPALEQLYERRGVSTGDVESYARERAVVGSVDSVVEQLERLRGAGVSYTVCRLGLPGLDRAQVHDATILFARGAAPRMRMFGFPEDIRVRSLDECSSPIIGYLAREGVA